MKTSVSVSLVFALFFIVPALLLAGGQGMTGGATLLRSPSARASALGEAFSGATDDVAAFNYNPAALRSLSSSQASFLYQKGLAEDTYGNFLLGIPAKSGSFGLSFGYYDAGKFEFFDGAVDKSVQAKRDLTAGIGYARKWNQFSIGISGKYLSSEVLETYKASAFAGDVGVQVGMAKGFTIGAALQNMGNGLQYVQETQQLPRVARLGTQWSLSVSNVNLNFLADVPYYLNEANLQPAFGLEGLLGPLALRVGYKLKGDLTGLNFGAGFMLGKMSLNYSYGMVKELDAEQRVSFSFAFGKADTDLKIAREDLPPAPVLTFSEQNNSNEVK